MSSLLLIALFSITGPSDSAILANIERNWKSTAASCYEIGFSQGQIKAWIDAGTTAQPVAVVAARYKALSDKALKACFVEETHVRHK